MQIYQSLNQGLPTACTQLKCPNSERKYCLISAVAVSLAEIAAEGAIMSVVSLESCLCSPGAGQRLSSLWNKGADPLA